MAHIVRPDRALALVLAVLLALAAPCRAQAQESGGYDAANPQNLTDDDLTAKAALVMDAATGTVLYAKNADRRTYPASTTKIVTCLVALENFPDLQQLVTVGAEAGQISSDSSVLGIRKGEQYPMLDLLYGMMLRSGNDAAMTIAVAVSGSVEAFAELMNQKAKELGCKDTHFVNPHGLHDESHYTTAYDMALIAQAAMKNRTFREIVAAKSYTMSATSQREKWRVETSNPMFVATSRFYYPDLVGIKTGYTSRAGRCFVGAADKDGVELISVVLKSKNTQDANGRDNGEYWVDTARLLDYGMTRYDTYTYTEMFNQAPIYAVIQNAARDDENGGMLKLQIVPGTALDTCVIKCLPEQAQEMLSQFGQSVSINYTRELTAPVEAGDILGTVTIDANGQPVTATVVASRSVAAEAVPFSLESLLPHVAQALNSRWVLLGGGLLVLILLLVIILRLRAAVRRRRRRKEMLRRRRAAYDRYRKM